MHKVREMQSGRVRENSIERNCICPNPSCQDLGEYDEGWYCRTCGSEVQSLPPSARRQVITQKRRNIDTGERVEESIETMFV